METSGGGFAGWKRNSGYVMMGGISRDVGVGVGVSVDVDVGDCEDEGEVEGEEAEGVVSTVVSF